MHKITDALNNNTLVSILCPDRRAIWMVGVEKWGKGEQGQRAAAKKGECKIGEKEGE